MHADMKIGLFVPFSVGTQQELKEGMAGQRTDLYQRTLFDIVALARYCDRHGYYGIGFPEHHLSIEGLTVSSNPALIAAFLAPVTEQLRLGVMGRALSVSDPLRVAGELAVLDQITQGRMFAGFSRGVQSRWVNTMGQHLGLADNITHPANYEAKKQRLFEENLDIVLKALSETVFSHVGSHWQIPPDNVSWPASDVSRSMGAGVDSTGKLTGVGIAPGTFEARRPTIFDPFVASDSAMRAAASRGTVPIGIVCHPYQMQAQIAAAAEGWRSCEGVDEPGRNMGFARYIVVADTDAKARALAEEALFEWTQFYSCWGFNAVLARPGDDDEVIGTGVEDFIDRGMLFCSSPATVCDALQQTTQQAQFEYLWLFTPTGLIPHDALMRHMSLLTEQVLPKFTNTIS